MLTYSVRLLFGVTLLLGSMTQGGCGSAGVRNGAGGAGALGGGAGTGGSSGGGGTGGSAGSAGQAGSTGSGGKAPTGGRGGTPGSGGASGGAGRGGSGGIGGLGGAGGASCDKIAAAYQLALQNARKCSNATGHLPCQTLVDSTLICHCKTFVDSPGTLPDIAAAWTAAGCTEVCTADCPATPTSSLCITAGDGAPAMCLDAF